jgi:hypothetical protein
MPRKGHLLCGHEVGVAAEGEVGATFSDTLAGEGLWCPRGRVASLRQVTTRIRVGDSRERKSFVGAEMRDLGAELLDTGAEMRDLGAELLDFGADLLDLGADLLDFGADLLDFGAGVLDT